MKRVFLGLCFVFLVSGAFATPPGKFFASVSASDTNTNTTLTSGNGVGQYKVVIVINDGPDTVYVDFDGVATDADIPVGINESPTFDFRGTPFVLTNIGLITGVGDTATVRLVALP